MKSNPPPQATRRKSKGLTLEDMVHFVLFRELDKLNVHFPYEKATRICTELKAAVQYRSPKKPPHKV